MQALGTGMVVPIGMNLTLTVSTPERLGTTMGIVSAMTTLGPSSGPIVAGAILRLGDRHLLFALFAVLVAAAWVAALVCVGDEAEITRPRLDAASTALISLALVGVLHGISTLFTGPVPVAVASLVVGLAALAAFVLRQGRIAEPLIDLRPLRTRSFALGLAVIVLTLMIVFSMNIVLPMFLESALGLSPLGAAGTLLPACILSCVLSPVAGRLYDRFGLRVLLPIALAVVAVFTGALSRLDGSAGPWLVMACYAPVIAGTAFTMGPAQTFALSALERPMHPHGTTIVSTCFQTAGCIGSSLLLGVLSGIQASRLAAGDPMSAATASDFRTAALVAVGVAVTALALSFALAGVERSRRTGLRVRVEPQPGRERIPADERTASADGSAAVGGESVVLD